MALKKPAGSYLTNQGAGKFPCFGPILENQIGIPDNLMPLMLEVVIGKRGNFNIFVGNHYAPNVTCVRD